MRSLALGLSLAPWTLALVVAGGCAQYSASEEPGLALPDQAQFVQENGVSAFMEKRCGGLDCHGQVGRPLRIYSANGLRFQDGPNGGRPTGATTAEERQENFIGVVGLEPEALSRVLVTEGEFTDLLLFRKPLDTEGGGVRHKGGPVLRFGDDGWRCLTSWAAGPQSFSAKACADAVNN